MTDDKETSLKEITEKLLKGMEPNEQLIKVLKGELLSPATNMTENFIPNLKNITIKCNSAKEFIDSINESLKTSDNHNNRKEVTKMTTIKDELIRYLLTERIDKVQKELYQQIGKSISRLETRIALAETIDETMHLKKEHKKLNELFDKVSDTTCLLNLTTKELEEVTGNKYITFGLFS